MVRVEILPAAHGDAIWIEYGGANPPRRILIDGGPAPSYEAGLRKRILALPEGERRIDLFAVTHVDADHIDGAILLLREARELGVRIDELWFNAWPQLDRFGPAVYAPLQGEFLGGLVEVTPALKRVWNRSFDGGAVEVPETGALPSLVLPDGARLTLLSPTARELKRLRARWQSAIRDFSPGDAAAALRRLEERREYRPPTGPPVFASRTFGDDRSVANGSSLAFLLEVRGASVLLAGDAHARVLASSLRRLAKERGVARLVVDAVKLPHHGSLSNMNEELVAAVECERWLVSTNGAIFDHPDVETARLVAAGQSRPVVMLCNYDSRTTRRLEKPPGAAPTWKTRFPGEASTEPAPAGGLALSLSSSRAVALRTARRKPVGPPRIAPAPRRSRGAGRGRSVR